MIRIFLFRIGSFSRLISLAQSLKTLRWYRFWIGKVHRELRSIFLRFISSWYRRAMGNFLWYENQLFLVRDQDAITLWLSFLDFCLWSLTQGSNPYISFSRVSHPWDVNRCFYCYARSKEENLSKIHRGWPLYCRNLLRNCILYFQGSMGPYNQDYHNCLMWYLLIEIHTCSDQNPQCKDVHLYRQIYFQAILSNRYF